MSKSEIIKILDEMILSKPELAPLNQFWMSAEYYKILGLGIYKGYEIYSSLLIPENSIYLGEMFFEDK